jgi:hypothetical protein
MEQPYSSQKLALTSSTSVGYSVGIVRSRTQATDFVFIQRCNEPSSWNLVLEMLLNSGPIRNFLAESKGF